MDTFTKEFSFEMLVTLEDCQENDIVLMDGEEVCVVETGIGLDDEEGKLFRPVDPNFFGQGLFYQDNDEFEGSHEVYLLQRCG